MNVAESARGPHCIAAHPRIGVPRQVAPTRIPPTRTTQTGRKFTPLWTAFASIAANPTLAEDVDSYLSVGGRWNTWAKGPAFAELSGVVTSGSEDFGGTSVYTAYEVDVKIDPSWYRRVEASVGIAGKWYVGLAVDDDQTWDDLRRFAARAGLGKAHLVLETGRLDGELELGEGHESPERFYMSDAEFESHYRSAAIALGEQHWIGPGVVWYQHPSAIGLYSDSGSAVIVDSDTSYYVIGLYLRQDALQDCLTEERLCDEPALVADLDSSYVGLTVTYGETAGLGLAMPSENALSHGSEVGPKAFAGLGVSGTFYPKLWYAHVGSRVSTAISIGLDVRQNSYILAGAGDQSLPETGGTKVTINDEAMNMHIFWGPSLEAAIAF